MTELKGSGELKKLIAAFISAAVLSMTGLITASAEVSEKYGFVPDNAVEYNGHYYMVYDDVAGFKGASWDKAQKFCKKRGGHLAVIDSEEEDKFLYDLVISSGHRDVFFGAEYADGKWKWVTGEKFSYKNWGDKSSKKGSEPYGQYHNKFSDGKWAAGSYKTDGTAYICEWDGGAKISSAEAEDGRKMIKKKTAVKHGDSYYRVFDTPLTRNEAASVCARLGGHLVYINDDSEQKYVAKLAAKDSSRNMYWIGAVGDGTKWKWIDGTPIDTMAHWSKDNNQSIEDKFAVLNISSSKYEKKKWVAVPAGGLNDADSESEYFINYGFICEWDIVCKSDSGNSISHSFGEWEVRTDSTCFHVGERVCVCSKCGEEKIETIAPKRHEMQLTGTIGKLKIPGLQVYSCQNCGETERSVKLSAIWILPSAVLFYVIFIFAYKQARKDFEAYANTHSIKIYTKPMPRPIFVIIPAAALAIAVLKIFV